MKSNFSMHVESESLPEDDLLYARIAWRLMPVLLLAYIVAFIDRVNVGFAKLQMQDALGFSDAVFGVGAGLMFVGYCLCEVPSNLLLARIGAKKSLLRIMVLWGLATVGTMFVTTAMQFYVARFFLGVFEAGLFPGVILYLTYWFPENRRGRVIGIFMTGALIGNVLAGPLSGWALKYLGGVGGLAGWQWLYITQGVPAIILGGVSCFWLTDGPSQARWLSMAEKRTIAHQLATNSRIASCARLGQVLEILNDRRFLGLVLIDFLIIGASYTMVFWVPTLIRGWGVVDVADVGLLSALPSLMGVASIWTWCSHSDAKKERCWHFVIACLVAAMGLWLTTIFQGHLILSLLALCVASAGISSTAPILITAATEQIPENSSTVGIPLLTSLGILGGFAGPAVTGLINNKTGSPVYSMYFVIALFLLAAILMLRVLPASRPLRKAR